MAAAFLGDWFGVHSGREGYSQPIKSRIFLEIPDQFQQYCEDCLKLKIPCYVSANYYKARNQLSHLEKMFFDFDCEADPKKAFSEASDFCRVLARYYRVKPLLVFSGKKGYHCYAWFKNVLEGSEQQLKQIYAKTQEKLLLGLKYETLDQQVIGDVKRLARVPYSIHEKSSALCQPIHFDTGEPIPIENLAVEDYRLNGFSNQFVEAICLDIKRSLEEKAKLHRKAYPNHARNSQLRPCLTNALQQNLSGNHGHLTRLAIAAEALTKGFSLEQTVQLFHNQSDFGDGAKSLYYVKDAFQKQYKPFTCRRIHELGFCLEATCPIFHRKIMQRHMS